MSIGLYSRVFGTLFVFLWMYKYIPIRYHAISFVLASFLTDFLDCRVPMCIDPEFSTKTNSYQFQDKLLDLFTYALIYLFTFHLYTTTERSFLLCIWLYRFVGVLKFIRSKGDVRYLHTYVDIINLSLLIMGIYKVLGIRSTPWLSIGVGTLFKYEFERTHHNQEYKKF